jgi:putative endonuclease
MKIGFVYLMANYQRGKTYLGVTSNLPQRTYQHRNSLIEGYSKEHKCHRLVWFECFDDIQDARAVEHRIKKWKRAWKIELIEKQNPYWDDLFDTLT